MGSPYAVLRSDRVSVIRTLRGFKQALIRIDGIIDGRLASRIELCSDFAALLELTEWFMDNSGSAEARLMFDLVYEAADALKARQRRVLFLEARYSWTGWEKFQSAIVLDFSGKTEPARKS